MCVNEFFNGSQGGWDAVDDHIILLCMFRKMSLCVTKPAIWVSDTNQAVQAQKMARGWKFWIYEEIVLSV